VLIEVLNPPQISCMRCGQAIRRGERVRVTITPGGGPNFVEHPDPCY
jgi:hypothetical protein